MFGTLFKQKDNTYQIARDLYAQALDNTRDPSFYIDGGVPDTFDGRFDVLMLHLFLILNPLVDTAQHDAIAQAVFDVTFKDMDQTLREMGIGDVGVPKHQKRMMKAFNGRMHNYKMAIDPESLADKDFEGLEATTLEEALKRNLFGTVMDGQEFDASCVDKMASFVRCNVAAQAKAVNDIAQGRIKFINAFDIEKG